MSPTVKQVTVTELFNSIGLRPEGPAKWREPNTEPGAGVYVVALVPDPGQGAPVVDVAALPARERAIWIPGQPVVYIGTTRRSLRRRLSEFFRHRYGEKAPHRGGQAIILLSELPKCPLWVYWAVAAGPSEAVEAERRMLEVFRKNVGALPFANRRR